jgi:hypothetical protein
MGAYLAAYTAEYPISAGLVEEGYLLTSPDLTAIVHVQPGTRVLGKTLRKKPDPLWGRTAMSYVAQTFIKQSGVWSSVSKIPPDHDRLVGGGYSNVLTLTELNELLAAGLITQDQYDDSIASV